MYQDSKDLSNELANKVKMGTLDAEKAFSLQSLINEGNLDQVKAELASAESMQEADISQEERQSQRDYSNFAKELNNALALANIDVTKSERIQGLINDGNLELAEKELEGLGITVGQEERQSQRDYSLAQKELTNRLTLANIDQTKAERIQTLINNGQLDLADKELEALEVTVGQEERQSQRDYSLAQKELTNRLTLANIDVTKAERIQTLINDGQLDLAEKEIEALGITTEADKEMQTERLTAASEDLRNELANRVSLGTLSMDQATTIQSLINEGNLDLATAELASAEAMQTERVGQEERQSQRDYANFKKELDNRLDLANIDLTKAERIQGLINSGNLEEANAELDSAERMQTEALESGERMQTERVQASSQDLRDELANRVELGDIDSARAIAIQGLINSGNLDLAQEELAGVKYTTDAEERMQTERIVSQEGQFDNELEFRKAIETGQIDGMPTLQSQLQKAQLADMMTARQAESLGQMLALANAMPNKQRAVVMAAISKPIQEFYDGGRGYTDTKIAIANILNVDAAAYGG
tara:strand:- start:352 stop:1962 length:1611 start_codon:yes stop_codon:yes gene_type:complete